MEFAIIAGAGVGKHAVEGQPDPAHVSTSDDERSNLSIRLQTGCFTRLTSDF